MSYCGLNNVKHKPIIDELVEKGLIVRFEEPWGEQNRIIKYRVSEKGKEIVNAILEPYELLFPRSAEEKEKKETLMDLMKFLHNFPLNLCRKVID